MTHVVSFTGIAPQSGTRLARFVAKFGDSRADRVERVRARRTALAMSEEARIQAQMRYRRMRYRHMAD